MTHHYTTKNPQSEARRQYVHGYLSERERHGEPSFWVGILCSGIAVAGCVAGIAALDMIVKGFAA